MKKIIIFLPALIMLFGYLPLVAQPDKPPYVSAVPKFTFGKTLKEQEEQLKTNPLMLRLQASRQKLADQNQVNQSASITALRLFTYLPFFFQP